MMNFIVLVCNVILMCCVVYDCFAVRKMFREYKDLLYKNQAQNNYITEREKEIDKLVKENNVLKELYNQVVEENKKSDKPVEEKKKRGPNPKSTEDKLDKVFKMLYKDDNLSLIQAFAKCGLKTYNTTRMLNIHGRTEEWLKIKDLRKRKPYEKVLAVVKKKNCSYKEACAETGLKYSTFFQLKAQYENI